MNLKLSPGKMAKMFSYGEQLHPVRDWMVILTIALCAGVVSLLWNVWLFGETVSGKQIGSSQTTAATTNTVAPSDITGVQSVFQSRASEEQNYQKNYKFVDPSVR